MKLLSENQVRYIVAEELARQDESQSIQIGRASCRERV